MALVPLDSMGTSPCKTHATTIIPNIFTAVSPAKLKHSENLTLGGTTIIIVRQEIYKAPTVWLKVLNMD